MPRRRMVSPGFWSDRKIGYLTREERGLILGCISQADDEGRLQADPAFLKAEVYKYDDDLSSETVKALRDSCLEKMGNWPKNHDYYMVLYTNSDEEYMWFRNWYEIQKPSHPTKSKLPAPPADTSGDTPEPLPNPSGDSPEPLPNPSGDSPSQCSVGQSSLVKVSIVESSEDITGLLNNEKDLTDYLTSTLEKVSARGPQHQMAAVRQFWRQATGYDMDTGLFQVLHESLKNYPIPVIAISLAKAVKYAPGKRKAHTYVQAVLKEKAEEFRKNNGGG